MSRSIKITRCNKLSGQIYIPGDKSISHRAIMIGSLAKGETIINNFLSSADCLATIACFKKMGIDIKITNYELRITNECKVIIRGKGLRGLSAPQGILDVGNSGTTIRLMMGILAGQEFVSEISGDDSIKRRPMGRVAKPLRDMGAAIEAIGHIGHRPSSPEELYAPLKIIGGNLSGITYEMPVASAQVKSAVLLAGLFAEGETCVIEKVPSRDHTERMLEYFGAGRGEFEGKEIDVPGDISSAAFFMVAAAIAPNSEIKILNVGINPTRTGIIDVLHRMNAEIEVQNERIICGEPRADILVRSSKLKAIKLDGEIIPRIIDEIPIIAVAATQAEGVTEIRGAKELRIKESDRIKTIASELRKLGAVIEELDDGLRITGPTELKGASLQSYGDHRIAMSGAIAGLVAEGETAIENTDCIETSFPGFEKILIAVSI